MNPLLRSPAMATDQMFRLIEALHRSSAVSYILDSELHIRHCNPAWDRFARYNDAPHLTSRSVVGRPLFDFIPEVLRPAYSHAFSQVLTTGDVWEKSYECSSRELYRLFRMRIHLLKPENWYLVTNVLIVEHSHDRIAAGSHIYLDSYSHVTICAHCRCSKRVDTTNVWDFVPEHLDWGLGLSRKVSHGLCPVCRVYYYPSV